MKTLILAIVLVPIPVTNNKSSSEEKEHISIFYNNLAVTGPFPSSEINSLRVAIFKFNFPVIMGSDLPMTEIF